MTRHEQRKIYESNGITCLSVGQAKDLYIKVKDILESYGLSVSDGSWLKVAYSSNDPYGFLALNDDELILYNRRDVTIFSQFHRVKIKTEEKEIIINKEYMNRLNKYLKIQEELQLVYNRL